jgi:hypothetical protein
MPLSCRLLPQVSDQAREPLGPDPHLEGVLPDIHPLDEELNDARLFSAEQLVPDRGEFGEQVRDFTGAPSSLVVWYRAIL